MLTIMNDHEFGARPFLDIHAGVSVTVSNEILLTTTALSMTEQEGCRVQSTPFSATEPIISPFRRAVHWSGRRTLVEVPPRTW